MFLFYKKKFKRQYILFLLVFMHTPCYVWSSEVTDATDAINSDSAIVIVVNTTVPDKKYSLADIRAIFAMRKTRWNNGQQIRVFVLADKSPLHHQFTKSKLNMFPHQFRRIWDRLVFSGTGQSPKEVESIEEMQHKLELIPGAIGYLNRTVEESNLRVLNYE